MKELTTELLKELLDYNPLTGIFRWKYRHLNYFNREHDCNAWNTRYSGTRAGNVSEGLLVIQILDKPHMASHLALIWNGVKLKRRQQVTHLNGVLLDDKLDNLELTIKKESKCPDVIWLQEQKEWLTIFKFKRKYYHCGIFKEEQDAIDAVTKKLAELEAA